MGRRAGLLNRFAEVAQGEKRAMERRRMNFGFFERILSLI